MTGLPIRDLGVRGGLFVVVTWLTTPSAMIFPFLTTTHPNGPPLPLVTFSIESAMARAINELVIFAHNKGDALRLRDSAHKHCSLDRLVHAVHQGLRLDSYPAACWIISQALRTSSFRVPRLPIATAGRFSPPGTVWDMNIFQSHWLVPSARDSLHGSLCIGNKQ